VAGSEWRGLRRWCECGGAYVRVESELAERGEQRASVGRCVCVLVQ